MKLGDFFSKKDLEKCKKMAKKTEYLRRRAKKSQAKVMDVHFCAFR